MSTTEPFSPVTIPTTDGLGIHGRLYEPSRAPLFDMLVLPGIGVPQRVFRHIAVWLRDQGVRIVTVDYRGVADSARDADAVATATLRTWAERDAVGAFRFVEGLAQGGPLLLLGHSFGGQALGFSDEFRRVTAAILIGSQFGNARYWDRGRWKVELYWRAILPLAARCFEVVPGWTGIGESIPRGVAREWSLWGRTPDWFLSHIPGARERYAAFDRPLRAYAMLDDPIAPPRAVTALLEQFRNTRVERIDLRPEDFGVSTLGHLGVFRAGPTERVWREILEYGIAMPNRRDDGLRAQAVAEARTSPES